MKKKIWMGVGLLAAGMGLGMLSVSAADSGASSQAQSRLALMTREEKIGQMLMVSPGQLCGGGDWTEQIDQVIQNLNFYHVGSLLFFAEDLNDMDAVKELTAAIAGEDGIPVLLAADASGSVASGLTKPEDSAQLAVSCVDGTGSCWAYSLEETPAQELKDMGIVLDVSAGSGQDFAVITHAVYGGADASAEMSRPASMTKSAVAELRSGFSGVILTDSLSVTDVVNSYGADMAVMYAMQAGADLLTAPANLMNAYYGMLSAIDEQMVTEEQINASVLRILDAKQALGFME